MKYKSLGVEMTPKGGGKKGDSPTSPKSSTGDKRGGGSEKGGREVGGGSTKGGKSATSQLSMADSKLIEVRGWEEGMCPLSLCIIPMCLDILVFGLTVQLLFGAVYYRLRI